MASQQTALLNASHLLFMFFHRIRDKEYGIGYLEKKVERNKRNEERKVTCEKETGVKLTIT